MKQSSSGLEHMGGQYEYSGHDYEMSNAAPAMAVMATGSYDSAPGYSPPMVYQPIPSGPAPMPIRSFASLGEDKPAEQKKPYLIPMPLIWAAGGLAVSLIGYAILAAKRR